MLAVQRGAKQNLIGLFECWSGHPQGCLLSSSSLQLATSFGAQHHYQASVSLKAAAPWKQMDFQKQVGLHKITTIFIFSFFSFHVLFFLLLPPLALLFLRHLQTDFVHKGFKKQMQLAIVNLEPLHWLGNFRESYIFMFRPSSTRLYSFRNLLSISSLAQRLRCFTILMGTKTRSSTALCGYPLLKLEIRDSCQNSTTAAIFFHYNYFRKTIWILASVQFHFWCIFGD